MDAFDLRIKELKSAQAIALAIWAGLNIGVGGILAIFSSGLFYYFFLMNFCWGIVDTPIAAFIFLHHNNDLKKPQSLLQQMDHQRHAEKVILFNVGLDLAFMASGAALYFYGNGMSIEYPELWQGFGSAVLLQGTYLLVQDLIFYRLHLENGKMAHPFWEETIERRLAE